MNVLPQTLASVPLGKLESMRNIRYVWIMKVRNLYLIEGSSLKRTVVLQFTIDIGVVEL